MSFPLVVGAIPTSQHIKRLYSEAGSEAQQANKVPDIPAPPQPRL